LQQPLILSLSKGEGLSASLAGALILRQAQGARAGSAPERLWQRGGMGPRVKPEDDAVAGCGGVLRRWAVSVSVSAWRSPWSVSSGVAVAPHPEPGEGRGAPGIPPGLIPDPSTGSG